MGRDEFAKFFLYNLKNRELDYSTLLIFYYKDQLKLY